MLGKGTALAAPQRGALRAGRGAEASTSRSRHGSVDIAVVSTLLRDPARCRCRTTSTRASSGGSAFRARRGWCSRPTRSRSRRWSAAGAGPEKLFRYPGLKEDYYLADFEPDDGGARTSSALDRERAVAASCVPPAARDLRVPRRQPALRGRARPARRPTPGAIAVVIPRTEGQARGRLARAGGDAVADRPERRDRRPEPDRLRRPGRQRRRHDEPRGGRARDARLHDLQRRDGRGRRAPDRRGRLRRARRSRRRSSSRKREAPAGVRQPARPAAARRRGAGRPLRAALDEQAAADALLDARTRSSRSSSRRRRLDARARRRVARPPDRRDRRPQRAQPARRARPRSSAGSRSSSRSWSPARSVLPWDERDPGDPRRRRGDRRASACSTTSSSSGALPKLLGQIVRRARSRSSAGVRVDVTSRCRSSAASTRTVEL